MKDGEIGIIWGQFPTLKNNIRYANGKAFIQLEGHYFNVIKIDGKLIYYDPQIGRYAVIRLKYKAFRYSKTN